MIRKGLIANIGAHGEPPIGLNYLAEMDFFAVGGLSNYEVGVEFVINAYLNHNFIIVGPLGGYSIWCENARLIFVSGIPFSWETGRLFGLSTRNRSPQRTDQ